MILWKWLDLYRLCSDIWGVSVNMYSVADGKVTWIIEIWTRRDHRCSKGMTFLLWDSPYIVLRYHTCTGNIRWKSLSPTIDRAVPLLRSRCWILKNRPLVKIICRNRQGTLYIVMISRVGFEDFTNSHLFAWILTSSIRLASMDYETV